MVYIWSKILQLTVELRGLSQDEKKNTVVATRENLKNDTQKGPLGERIHPSCHFVNLLNKSNYFLSLR